MGDKDIVTEDYCEKKHRIILEKIVNIDKLFNGDKDIEEGIRYKTQILWSDYQQRKKTTMGWLDWLYRTVIGIMLTWISAAAVWLMQRMGTM